MRGPPEPEEQTPSGERIPFDAYIEWGRGTLGLDLSAPAIRQQFLVNQTAALNVRGRKWFFPRNHSTSDRLFYNLRPIRWLPPAYE